MIEKEGGPDFPPDILRITKVGKDLSDPQIQLYPMPTTDHIPQCHISMVLEHLQGW